MYIHTYVYIYIYDPFTLHQVTKEQCWATTARTERTTIRC